MEGHVRKNEHWRRCERLNTGGNAQGRSFHLEFKQKLKMRLEFYGRPYRKLRIIPESRRLIKAPPVTKIGNTRTSFGTSPHGLVTWADGPRLAKKQL
jgi:hypothetical protein